MDLLTDLLADLRFESSVFCRVEGQAPWGVRYRGQTLAGVHAVLEGRCTLALDGHPPLSLGPGDLVVLPTSAGHAMVDGVPVGRALMMEEVLRRNLPGACPVRVSGGTGRRTTYVCGGFRFGAQATHPALAALPPLIHIPGVDGRPAAWFTTYLELITAELGGTRPGSGMVLTRLADALFVQAVRAHLETMPAASGWMSALGDPPVAAALAEIHRDPGRAWTVASLASAVGLSRSTFAERFSLRVGQPPLRYLAAWRMYRATELLRSGALAVGEVAARLGYDSAASFATAYRRWTGATPGSVRRARAAPAASRA